VVVDADSWDEPTPPVPLENERTRGPGASRLRLMVGLVLLALAAAVAIPFALSSGAGDPPVAAGSPTAVDEPPQISAVSSEPTPPAPPAVTVAASPAASPPAAPGQTSTFIAPPPAEATDPDPATTTAGDSLPDIPPAFAPVTYEAEAGTVTGSAWSWDGYPTASGGWIVRNIGNWGGTPGTLRINEVVTPTTGLYTITVYFVHINDESTRLATVTVSGLPAMTVTFNGGNDCCQSIALTNITISAGMHTITFANPTGHAPSIDMVVVSRS
jgi:hypothetical protein